MARVTTRTSLFLEALLLVPGATLSSGSVDDVTAMRLPSGDHTGADAPFARCVSGRASPPSMGMSHTCATSGRSSFTVERVNAIVFPSGDQRGAVSNGPDENGCGWLLPSVRTMYSDSS